MKSIQIILIALMISCVMVLSQKVEFPYTLFNNEIPMDVRLQILNITNSQNCTTSSPINQIKYNYTKVTEVKFADFCTDYSQRTCCSNDNLNQLRLQLICYDCDGDVGQGMRKGVCSQQCEVLYEVCKNDYFIIDQNTQAIKVCSRSDIMCSQLSNIVSKKTDFCKLLGHEINDNNDYEEWFYQFYADSPESFQQTLRPVCWNFMPSSNIFGPAIAQSNQDPTKGKKTDTPKNPFDKFNQKYSTIINILYIILAFILVLIIVFIAFYCLKSRNQESRGGGRRIGGSTKNHHTD